MIKSIRIQLLKYRARLVYKAYNSELDEFSCGASLALTIRPSIGRLSKKFNTIMDKIQKLDPTAPKGRLE